MAKGTNTLSASEMNRYTYCPYQWYYEKVYGRKELYHLSQQKKQKEKSSNKTSKTSSKPSTQGNFKRGLKFHEEQYRLLLEQQSLRRRRLVFAAAVVTAVVIIFLLCYGVHVTRIFS